MMHRWSLGLLLALAACAGSPQPAVDRAGPTFAPIAFFAGHTEGNGELKVILSGVRKVHVEGEGTVAPNGTLALVQQVEQEGKPARTRSWSLRPDGQGGYVGVLSDAVGPVTATVSGNLLHIRFHAKGGFAIEQWLALQPGGRVAHNRLIVSKFGVRVATLNETIRKTN